MENILHMDRHVVDAFGGFHDGFADGWVSVNDAAYAAN